MEEVHRIFEAGWESYDRWFDEHPRVYQSELQALEQFVPEGGISLEVGVGSGRYAVPLGILFGIDPSERMAAIARQRGNQAIVGKGEFLPFRDCTFDLILVVHAIVFLSDLSGTLRECHRTLRGGGALVLGVIERESPLGRELLSDPESRDFFGSGRFPTPGEIRHHLETTGFLSVAAVKVFFEDFGPVPSGFVIVSARKAG